VVLDDLHAAEQLVQMPGDDVFQGDVSALGERDETRQHGRHLDPRELAYAGLGVAHQYGEIDRQTGDIGKGMRRVDGERGEDGEDALGEEVVHPILLVGGQLVPTQDLDAFGGQLRADLLGEHPGLFGDQLLRPAEDRGVQVAGHHPAEAGHGDAGGDPPLEPGDSHHVELVQIGGEDGQELGPLQQGHPEPVLGQIQHSVVEGQPGQLAVQEAVGRQRVGQERLHRALLDRHRDVDCLHQLS
jgi:hypothetical protein